VAGREKNYPPKIKVGDAELETVNIYRNTFHGEWNYEIRPHSRTSALTAIIVARVVTKQLHRVGELRRKAVLRAGRVVRRRYAASAGLSAENCCQRLSSASPFRCHCCGSSPVPRRSGGGRLLFFPRIATRLLKMLPPESSLPPALPLRNPICP